jgi:hypothetical protein
MLASTTNARQWKPGTLEAIQDYVIIEHAPSANEFIIVMWLAPELLGDEVNDAAVDSFFEEYIMLGIGHASISDLGEWSFTPPTGVMLETKSEGERPPISDIALPPMATMLESGLGSIFAAGMGQFGESINWFFFPANGIMSCAPGKFWIVYGPERYEYETPIPGCE